jgi:hypothetical protein
MYVCSLTFLYTYLSDGLLLVPLVSSPDLQQEQKTKQNVAQVGVDVIEV